MPGPRQCFVLALVDARPNDPDAGPVNVRLRRALKVLLRGFGLKCIRIEAHPMPIPGPGKLAEAFGGHEPPHGTPDAADAVLGDAGPV